MQEDFILQMVVESKNAMKRIIFCKKKKKKKNARPKRLAFWESAPQNS